MMRAPYELVVLTDDWDGLPFSCKHLLKHFLPHSRLIWVETIGLRSPRLSSYDVRRAASKVLDWVAPAGKRRPGPLPVNLTVVKPIQIPYNQWSPVRRLNRQLMLRRVRAALGNVKRIPRIFLTTWPFVGNLVGAFDEDLSVYYRVDDFSEFPGVDKARVSGWERELILQVDLIVASSERLTRLETSSEKVRYLPHGVDCSHFVRPSPSAALPPIFQDLPRPYIGFFGLLDKWLDLPRIAEVARRRPDWTFVFIGPSQLPRSELPTLPNLHFPGPIPYAELPQVAGHFDVALIPFKMNALTSAVNPLKLMEYLALGLPVVSSPLPEVVKFKEQVRLAETTDEFISAIEAALAANTERGRVERRALAESMSWESKSGKLQDWIDTVLERTLRVFMLASLSSGGSLLC
jgi:glycosyltransferase involved in cell wall biosynthesis